MIGFIIVLYPFSRPTKEAPLLYCDMVISKFDFQLHYYVHFQADSLKKVMNSRFPPTIG